MTDKKERRAALQPGMQLLAVERGRIVSSYPIGAEAITLGRDEENVICIPDARASRRHAMVRIQDGCVVVEDLKSSNGTWVNERKVSLQALRPGDTLRVARTALVYAEVRPAAGPAGWIVARTLTGSQAALPLAERSLIIGRAEQADIRFDDAGLADCHAVIVAQPGGASGAPAVELVLLTGPCPRRVPLPDGADVPVGALTVRFQTQPPATAESGEPQPDAAASRPSPIAAAKEDSAPRQDSPIAPKKRAAQKRKEESIHIRPTVGEMTLMGAIRQEAERVEREPVQPRAPKASGSDPETEVVPEERFEGLRITVTKGPRLGETFLVGRELFTIGRDAICTLRLDAPSVAPRHAWIRLHGDKAFIEDLGTPGGTCINGHRVRRHAVAPGDSIRIGEGEMLVHL